MSDDWITPENAAEAAAGKPDPEPAAPEPAAPAASPDATVIAPLGGTDRAVPPVASAPPAAPTMVGQVPGAPQPTPQAAPPVAPVAPQGYQPPPVAPAAPAPAPSPAPVYPVAAAPVAPVVPVGQWNAAPYPGPGGPGFGAPQRKSRTGLIIGLVAAVLLLVVGGGVTAFLLLGGDDESSSNAAKDKNSGDGGDKSDGPAPEADPLAELEEMASDLFPGSIDDSYATSWSTESDNLDGTVQRHLAKGDRESATSWWVGYQDGDHYFYIYVQYEPSDYDNDYGCEQEFGCAEDVSPDGKGVRINVSNYNAGTGGDDEVYYRSVSLPGDARNGEPEITISEGIENQVADLDPLTVMDTQGSLTLRQLLKAIDDGRLTAVPPPDPEPPLPSFQACSYNFGDDIPDTCPDAFKS